MSIVLELTVPTEYPAGAGLDACAGNRDRNRVLERMGR